MAQQNQVKQPGQPIPKVISPKIGEPKKSNPKLLLNGSSVISINGRSVTLVRKAVIGGQSVTLDSFKELFDLSGLTQSEFDLAISAMKAAIFYANRSVLSTKVGSPRTNAAGVLIPPPGPNALERFRNRTKAMITANRLKEQALKEEIDNQPDNDKGILGNLSKP